MLRVHTHVFVLAFKVTVAVLKIWRKHYKHTLTHRLECGCDDTDDRVVVSTEYNGSIALNSNRCNPYTCISASRFNSSDVYFVALEWHGHGILLLAQLIFIFCKQPGSFTMVQESRDVRNEMRKYYDTISNFDTTTPVVSLPYFDYTSLGSHLAQATTHFPSRLFLSD